MHLFTYRRWLLLDKYGTRGEVKQSNMCLKKKFKKIRDIECIDF